MRARPRPSTRRYTTLIIELTRWLDQADWRERLDAKKHRMLNKRVNRFASRTLRKRHNKLLKRGRNLPDQEPQRRHRARIAAKKLRYATEFFACLYPKTVMRNYLASLGEFQDDLGWRNDIAVADGLLKTLGSRREAATGAAYARGFMASREAADYKVLDKLWK